MALKKRKKPTKHFIIKVIKDDLGVDWDVYEETKTESGLIIYRGWHYGCSPSDGSASPVFSYILTRELGDLIKVKPIKDVKAETGLSLSCIAKMRLALGVNRNFVYRDDQWIKKNKEEILNASYQTLKKKYNLTRSQVNTHRIWAAELFEIEKRTRLRKTDHDESYDKWFVDNYENIAGLSVKDIMNNYGLSKYIAIKTFNRYQKNNNGLSYSETLKKDKEKDEKWLIANKDLFHNQALSAIELGTKFNKSESQIARLRKKLRKLLLDQCDHS